MTGAGSAAALRRIDLEHANAKRRWQQMGEPEYPSTAEVAELHEVSRLTKELQPFVLTGGALRVKTIMPPQSVAAIDLIL